MGEEGATLLFFVCVFLDCLLYGFFHPRPLILKPIFHWKRRLRWLPNANDMDTNNMKCKCPMRDLCVGDPTQPIFHWLALGFCVGGNANLRVHVGSKIPTCWYPQRKILALGVLPNANPQRQGFCVAVEYSTATQNHWRWGIALD